MERKYYEHSQLAARLGSVTLVSVAADRCSFQSWNHWFSPSSCGQLLDLGVFRKGRWRFQLPHNLRRNIRIIRKYPNSPKKYPKSPRKSEMLCVKKHQNKTSNTKLKNPHSLILVNMHKTIDTWLVNWHLTLYICQNLAYLVKYLSTQK